MTDGERRYRNVPSNAKRSRLHQSLTGRRNLVGMPTPKYLHITSASLLSLLRRAWYQGYQRIPTEHITVSDPSDILNLPTMRVLSQETQMGQCVVYAEANTGPEPCDKCGSFEFYGHGTREQVFVDSPTHGDLVTIVVHRKRYRCRSCGATSLQPLPDMAVINGDEDDGHMMTKRLVEHVGKEGLRKTFADVARETGLSERTVRRLVADHVRDLTDSVSFETPNWMGLDEIHIIDHICGVVTNVERNCMVDLLPRRDIKFLSEYMVNLKEKERVKLVTIDMWRPYQKVAAEHLPGAKVVIDKFHVVRMANDVLDTVRKQAQKHLPTGERIALKNERGQLYKRAKNLDKHGLAAVNKWTKKLPLLEDIWLAKEAFFEIWDVARTSDEAKAIYDQWEAELPEAVREAFIPITRALGNWREEIFCYFDNRATNAYTESLNSLIRAVNHIGRGYSFETLRAKMLFAHGQHVRDGRKIDRDRRISNSGGPFPDSMIWGVDLRHLADMIERGEI